MDGAGTFVLVCIDGCATVIGHDLNWHGGRLGVVLVHIDRRLDQGAVLVDRRQRSGVMLQRYGGATGESIRGDRRVYGSWELGKLLLLWLWYHCLL